MAQWATDSQFRCGSVQELVWHTAAGNPGYEYQFSRTVHGKEALGAPHGSEVPFVFGTLAVTESRAVQRGGSACRREMQEYWTNFAKTGDPNGGNLPQVAEVRRDGAPVSRLHGCRPGSQRRTADGRSATCLWRIRNA